MFCLVLLLYPQTWQTNAPSGIRPIKVSIFWSTSPWSALQAAKQYHEHWRHSLWNMHSTKKVLACLKVVFQGRCVLMDIIHMASHALSCFENLLTDFTLQARMCDVECFDVPWHVTLKLELLATIKTPPHRSTRDVHRSCHVWSNQGIKIVKPCKQMSRQRPKFKGAVHNMDEAPWMWCNSISGRIGCMDLLVG